MVYLVTNVLMVGVIDVLSIRVPVRNVLMLDIFSTDVDLSYLDPAIWDVGVVTVDQMRNMGEPY